MSQPTETLTAEEKKTRRAAYMSRWRRENRERVRANKKAWGEANRDHRLDYARAYNVEYWAKNEVQEKAWVHKLHSNYRMTASDFNELWTKQNGKCAVCEVTMKPRGRQGNCAAVDHNHETGEVRGLLCCDCNRGIGCLKDNPEVLQRAADYLMVNGHYAAFQKDK